MYPTQILISRFVISFLCLLRQDRQQRVELSQERFFCVRVLQRSASVQVGLGRAGLGIYSRKRHRKAPFRAF